MALIWEGEIDMPFKSKAQITKFRELVAEKKISQKEFDKWMKETKKPEKLPNRIMKAGS
jgi:hypothetical protein